MKKETANKASKYSRRRKNNVPSTLIELSDRLFASRIKLFASIIIGLMTLLCLLFLNNDISLTGDDSAYIMRAHALVNSFTFPDYQGPLFPFLLSLFVAIFGINLIFLKIPSLISMVVFLFLFIRFFRNKISPTLLLISALLIAVNSYILYYATLTYSEAFYMLTQIILIGVFFSRFIDKDTDKDHNKLIIDHLLLACCLLSMALTRSVGFSALGAIVVFFLFTKKWRDILYSVAAFSILFFLFQGVKFLIWNNEGLHFAQQGGSLLLKDFYNPHAGTEDISGLIKRFIENSNIYISNHFTGMTGLRQYVPYMTVKPFLTIILAGIFVSTLIFSFKKNKHLFFVGLLSLSFLTISFIVLQSSWDQNRLILPVLPFLILLLLYFFEQLGKYKKAGLLHIAIPIISIIMLLNSLNVTIMAARMNRENSERFSAYTPDWKNYMLASEWVADNLPKNVRVVCRKPSISFIYGRGYDFFGIYRLPQYNNDAFFDLWKNNEQNIILLYQHDFWNMLVGPDQNIKYLDNILAVVFTDEDIMLAMKFSNQETNELKTLLLDNEVDVFESSEEFRSKFLTFESLLGVFYPDSMLTHLYTNNITHLLSANIRINNEVKDGLTLNTIERYAALIEEKYPGVFKKIAQIGHDNNEPASIYVVDYERYGIH